jgi:hypothetical protein
VVTGRGGEFGAEEILAIHEVDGLSRTECGFEFGVVGLPSHNLSIRARQINIDDDSTRVWDKNLSYVWEAKLVQM